MPECKKCSEMKPHHEFYRVRGKLYTYLCKKCKAEDYRIRYRNGYGEKLKERRRKNAVVLRQKEHDYRNTNPESEKGKRLQKYWPGTTRKEALDNFKALVLLQQNNCAICGRKETRKYNRPPYQIRDLSVDHDHKTGKVRGLLCDECNTLIARARDCPETCESAAHYLRRTQG